MGMCRERRGWLCVAVVHKEDSDLGSARCCIVHIHDGVEEDYITGRELVQKSVMNVNRDE